ncbi:uncharacterized protein TRUGW13939_11550, partial [Talaromyces rugulosus]
MDRSMFTSAEVILAKERHLKYQGTAKIKISQISLPLEYKPDNVDRLCGIFEKENCDRIALRNHVVATISKENLMRALSDQQTNLSSLMGQQSDRHVHLDFPVGQIVCLHGQHRLRAGNEFLAPYERWWTVDLYLNDMSSELQTELTEEYSNEAQPNDGEVYRKVRQYQYEASSRFEDRWLARLSPNKQKRMRQLSQPENASIRSAFDALLPIPGLWKVMSIGNLPRIIALKCDEEIVHYLQYVKDFWSSLVRDDRNQMEKIDYATIKELQLLVPGGLDRRKVKGLVLSGEAFSKFDRSERKAIWRKLRGRKELIPSLYTFFKDISYLEACASCLKRLVDLAGLRRPTMYSAMKHMYNPNEHVRGHYRVQESETGFRECSGTAEEARDAGYRQLWLFAFRHYPKMPNAVQKGKRLVKAKFQGADQRTVHRMAVLASQLGFTSPQILQINRESPDRQLARTALLEARERDDYRYRSIESLIDRMLELFQEAIPTDSQPSYHQRAFPTVPRRRRCGQPCIEAHEQERKFLFFDHMEGPSSDNEVSALFVRRCVYFAFFGKPSEPSQIPLDEDVSSHHSPRSHSSSLSFPEEHNLFDEREMADISDHATGRPDHRTDERDQQDQGDHRREERRRQRQAREVRRSQRREQKRERRQQRQLRRQQRRTRGEGGEGSTAGTELVDQDGMSLSDGRASTLGDMNELDIFNEYERSPTQPDHGIANDTEEGNTEMIAATNTDQQHPDASTHPGALLETVQHTATEQFIAAPVGQPQTPNQSSADSTENTTRQEAVTEPSPDNYVERIIDDNVGSNQPVQGVAVSPPLNQGKDDVSVEEADTLPELPSDDRIANHRLTLGPRKKQMADRRPLKTAASKRRAAERSRLAAVDAVPAESPIFAENRGTQLDVDRIPGSTEQESSQLEDPSAGPGLELPTEELVAQQRANTLSQLENGQSAPPPVLIEQQASSEPVPSSSMQNFITRLRESPNSEEDNCETILETGKAQFEFSHGDQLEHYVEKQPAERTAPATVESAPVADTPVGRDKPRSPPPGESRRELPAEQKAADEASRQQKATTQVESAQRSVEESEDSFTRTRAAGNLFSDEDDDDEDHISPDEGRSLEPLAGLASHSTPAHGENDADSLTHPLGRTNRKRFARTARHAPYQRPPTKGRQKPARRDTQIDVDNSPSDNISELFHQPPPEVPPTDLVPDNETADTGLRVPDGRSNDRRKKAANRIRQQRSPSTPISHEQSNRVIIFRVWTGLRWSERTKVDLGASDPLQVEREARRFVEHYYANLRDARMRSMTPVECLQSARDDGSNSIFVIFPEDGEVTDAMEQAAAKFIIRRASQQILSR